jgi:hypothetical protein
MSIATPRRCYWVCAACRAVSLLQLLGLHRPGTGVTKAQAAEMDTMGDHVT